MLKRAVAVIHIPDNLSQKIEFLLGSSDAISNEPIEIFSEQRVAFLAQLSRLLLADPVGKSMPDIAAFAYWCRQANLERMRERYDPKSRLQMGLGLTFHICPANVPVNFAFSMAFGLLSGNSCVLRLPSKPSATIDLLASAIQKQLNEPCYQHLRQDLVLMRFDRDDEIVKFLISIADGRIIWGGDETVAHMRSFPSKPRSREVAFPDRYSLCLLEPVCILEMGKQAFDRFCFALYNDIYLMDQSACSSPQLIAWIGEPKEVEAAQRKLWPEVVKIARQKYPLQAVHVIDKFTAVCRNSIANLGVQSIERNTNVLYRIQLSFLDKHQDECRGYFGTIHEVVLPHLDALAPIVSERYQTLTVQGIDHTVIRQWITRNRLRGIDRVVPVGRALDMSILWDGYDLIGSLSRVVDL
ncbi:acyl-CoA reductase [beta proteobacterium MWH-UniP1]